MAHAHTTGGNNLPRKTPTGYCQRLQFMNQVISTCMMILGDGDIAHLLRKTHSNMLRNTAAHTVPSMDHGDQPRLWTVAHEI